ncbi:MAG: glycine zipper 2TM domain-containing protein [Rhodanobacteraceae bacterium]|jgi:outer membrane lipoprotein SlyB|nr:glycine zipper 2TM domain-containing protein [Rhodanobacteraceae bacterium]
MRTRIVLMLLALLTLAACATPPRYYNDGYRSACNNCGTIERIERVYGERETTGGGAVLGAIIGGALGNQVGKGDGRKAATVAGAVIGGVIGNEAEKDQRSRPRFEIFVQMDDGRRLVVEQPTLDGLREGDYVQIVGNRARLF